MTPSDCRDWFSIIWSIFLLTAVAVYFFDKLINRPRTGKIFDVVIAVGTGVLFLKQISGITLMESLCFAGAMFLFSEAFEDLRQWRKNKHPEKEQGKSGGQ